MGSKNNNHKIEPAPGYVLIKPVEVKRQTASGIVLPDTHEGDKPQEGEILAVGKETKDEKSFGEVGDLVVYRKWGGNDYKREGQELLFVKFEDILAKIK